MAQVLIVDDHPLVREAVGNAVQAVLSPCVILEAGTVGEACRSASRAGPAIILLDLLLPDVSGLDGFLAVRSHFPGVPILVFTALEDARIAAEALALGAAGYVPKSAGRPILVAAIAEVLQGRTYVPEPLASAMHRIRPEKPVCTDIASRVCSLTRREIKVLRLVRRGLLNKQIAHELGIGETTVKAHVTAILRKLKVVSRTQVVLATSHLDLDAILRNKAACEASSGRISSSDD
jgi:DNA-binding NarL/FixJ family response regulator